MPIAMLAPQLRSVGVHKNHARGVHQDGVFDFLVALRAFFEGLHHTRQIESGQVVFDLLG